MSKAGLWRFFFSFAFVCFVATNHTVLAQTAPDTPQGFLEQGWDYADNSDYEAAVTSYTLAIQLDPAFSTAYYWRARAHYELANYEDSIKDFTRAIDLNYSDLADAYYNRGGAYYQLERYEESIKDFDQAIALTPNDTIPYYMRARSYQALDLYGQALADASMSIKLDPEYYAAYMRRGRIYYDMEEYQNAAQDFTGAIALDPEFPLAYFWRGYTYHAMDQCATAIPEYSRAIELNYEDIEFAYNNRGICYRVLHQYEDALADQNAAIALRTDNARFYRERGENLYMLTRYEESLPDLNQAITLNPEDSFSFYLRAGAYEELEQYDQALVDISKAIELNADYVSAFIRRGSIYYYMEQYDSALQDFNHALELDPQSATAHYWIGYTYHATDKFEPAISEYTRAIELNYVDTPYAYGNRGICYRVLGEYKLALPDLNTAIAALPDYFRYYSERGQVYYRQKQYDTALPDLNKAIELNPDYIYTYSSRGFTYLNLEQYDLALADAGTMLQLDPKFPDSYELRGNVAFRRGDRAAMESAYEQYKDITGDYQSYMYTQLDKTRSISPSSPLLIIGMLALGVVIIGARISMQLRFRTWRGSKPLSVSVAKLPSLALGQVLLGALAFLFFLVGLVDPKQNIIVLGAALALMVLILALRSWFYVLMLYLADWRQQPLSAIYWWEKLLRQYSGHIPGYEELIKLYGITDNLSGAADFLTATLARIKKPSSRTALYIRRGSVYLQLRDQVAAKEDFKEAVKLDPNNAKVYFDLGVAFYKNYDFDTALAAYQKSFALGNDSAALFNNRAMIYIHTGQLDQAYEDYQRALAKDGGNPAINMGIGQYFFLRKDYKRAREYYNKVKRMGYGSLLMPMYNIGTPTASHQHIIRIGMAILDYASGKQQQAYKDWAKYTRRDARYRDLKWVQQEAQLTKPELEIVRELINAG